MFVCVKKSFFCGERDFDVVDKKNVVQIPLGKRLCFHEIFRIQFSFLSIYTIFRISNLGDVKIRFASTLVKDFIEFIS